MSDNTADFLALTRAPVGVRELVADTLRQAIIRGDLLPGERLMEADLAKRMGVSRPSLREALSQLAAEKLITIVPNRGPSVASINWKEAQEIYQVRSLMEGEVAHLFALKATRPQLDSMHAALARFKQAMDPCDTLGLVSSTAEFYAVMFEGCGNGIITELLAGLNARIGILRARSMSRPGRAVHSLAEMGAILACLEKGDAKGARAAVEAHVEAAAAAARESFNQLKKQEAASKAR
ncbi:GntR family transcriptional regulator [Ancylobacter oerskovii]|uniref:GntR family transcriptional regulator n=1 Tax=Ancylobacter oerskovii TaxID=459519 RepID=A0ABW4Z047_9HYPH|nr:GntR family transcriptional regulator [Ancylobacter oerskovii]MBS7542831.1 GntR family transcriptional regulator [Ancylobacter oerskovii]